MSENKKTCTKCGKSFPATAEYFHRDKSKKDGLRETCKKCESERHREYRKKNPEKLREYKREYRKKNPEKLKEYAKRYYEENAEKVKERSKRYGEENPEKVKENRRRYFRRNSERYREYRREYRKKNPEEVRERDKRYRKKNREKVKERYKKDPTFRLRQAVSLSVRRGLKSQGGSKNGGSTFAHLPYTPEDLRQYIESKFDEHMTWDNHGTYWHLHHIVFQSQLPYDSLTHPNFLKCWSLDNLIPVSIEEHKKIHGGVLEG